MGITNIQEKSGDVKIALWSTKSNWSDANANNLKKASIELTFTCPVP